MRTFETTEDENPVHIRGRLPSRPPATRSFLVDLVFILGAAIVCAVVVDLLVGCGTPIASDDRDERDAIATPPLPTATAIGRLPPRPTATAIGRLPHPDAGGDAQ